MTARAPRRARPAAVLAALAVVLGAGVALAQLHQPDASLHDAQQDLRAAARDTVGRSSDLGRLDTLGVAMLRLAHQNDARRVFERVLALDPADAGANAGLGRLALVEGRLADAESLITRAIAHDRDPEAVHDLFVVYLRRQSWAQAAALAEEAGEPGRVPMLEHLAEAAPAVLSFGPDEVRIPFTLTYPVPCVRVKLNGESVLLAIDTGARDVLLDSPVARRVGAELITSQSPTDWLGKHQVVGDGRLRTLELGGMRLDNVPIGTLGLHAFGLQLNPRSEPVAGVLGLVVLRAFRPSIDWREMTLVLRRPGAAWTPGPGAVRVPFQVWGECALMVTGALNGGRATWFQVHTGIPECGFAAPTEVFAEAGAKAGGVSNLMKHASGWLQGVPWARVSVSGVSAGQITSRSLPGWAMESGTDPLWRYGMRSDGYLSNDFFRSWCVTLDWATSSLVFEPKQ